MSSCYLLDVHLIVNEKKRIESSGLFEVLFEQFNISYHSLTLSGKGQPRVSSETHFASYAMYFQTIHYEGITP
ncbi:hypothetical protein BCON_0072g00080 [Botryotinia convoluta]|uniref:Uncharacterized protein n=1 Tax=Botryotinia convoluta TaxID=54673 RepID=A0A4Z1IJM8_9HELO|nr:hypothetical protein BCON_0072g00080 [Botryotinia convoluta]